MPTAAPFAAIIEEYIATVDNLRSLLKNVLPELSQRDRESMTLQGILAKLSMSDGHAQRIEAAWDIERARIIGEIRSGDKPAPLVDFVASLDTLPDDAREAIVEQIASREALFTSPVLSAFPDGPAVSEFIRQARALGRPISVDMFNRFILTSAFSSFESLIYAMVENYYVAKQDEVVKGSAEAEYSLKDLMSYESLEDAVEEAIQNRIEGFLFKGFAAWARWWKSELAVTWQTYALDWSRLQESLERRHCVTHNSGRVTRKYLRTVPGERLDGKLSVGSPLRTSPRYLSMVLDELLVLGCMVALETWKRVDPPEDAQEIGTVTVSVSYEMLQQERWEAASHFCTCALQHLGLAEAEKLLVLCNRWIAEKYRSSPEIDVAEEVSAWPVDHLSREFAVAKAALLGDYDTLPDLVRGAISSESFAVSNLRNWPLFKEFRETNGFLPLLAELEGNLEPITVLVDSEDSSIDSNNTIVDQ